MGRKNKKTLRNRMFHAGAWVGLSFLLGQVLRFGSNLILTRLLVPEMFGVMAIVAVIQTGLAMFSDVGLAPSIVQNRRGGERLFLNTAWVIQIIRGCLIFLCMLLLSWLLSWSGSYGWLPAGSVYANPILPSVLVFSSLGVLIGGFSSTKLHLATRDMQLAGVSLLELGCQFFGIVVMVILAWIEPNIWAIVIGGLVTRLSSAVLSHVVLFGENNRIQWDVSAFYEIFHFGKWIFLSSIVGFLSAQGDRLLLGGVVSSATLGLYSIAFFLANAMLLLLNKVSGLVFFPTLSEVVRERPDDLAKVYYKIRWRIDALVFLTAGTLFISGGTIIDLLYDQRYHEAGGMLQILSLSLISVGYLTSNQCFLGLGRADVASIIKFIQMVVLFGLLPVFSVFGLKGALLIVAAAPIVSGIASWWFMYKFGLLQMKRELMMLPLLLVGALVGLGFNYVVG